MQAVFYDFNPRSREGSDGVTAQLKNQDEIISIHAPAKGATNTDTYIKIFGVISIHAPAKGATRYRHQPNKRLGDFNPRSREGSDSRNRCCDKSMANFNPRSREGSDKPATAGLLHRKHFNPRSREGSDDAVNGHFDSIVFISIHAPAKGATSRTTQILPA